MASTRYRCFYPAIALSKLGIQSRFYRRSEKARRDLDQLDAIIFVKRFDDGSVRLATEARAKGRKVLVDLCDNVVVSDYEEDGSPRCALQLAAVGLAAEAIVTATSALADAVRAVLPEDVRFAVIPDQIETRASIAEAARLTPRHARRASLRPSANPSLRLLARAADFGRIAASDPGQGARILMRKLSAIPPSLSRWCQRRSAALATASSTTLGVRPPACKTVLWFGNHGAVHSDFGMLAILQAVPALEAVARDIPIELVVISNNRQLFDSYIAPQGFASRYVEWSPDAVFDALESADVCLLPFGRDAFSVTKSANRAVLALHHGVPVVASRLDSFESLADVIVLDDWEHGLRRFLGPDGARQRGEALARARPLLDRSYSAAAVGEAWLKLLSAPRRRLRFGRTRSDRVEVGVVLNLAQDLDILLPIIDELRRRPEVAPRVMMAPGLAEASKRSLRALVERGIVPYALDGPAVLAGENRMLRDLDSLLSVETSLNPHKIAHALTKSARALGVATFTLQHGIENVGLTYCDRVHGPDVAFASEHVLTWADPSLLPTWVKGDTRAKCIAVGRPGIARPATAPMPPGLRGRPIVGVFENLHWERYSARFVESFCTDLLELARDRPDVAVLLKPHHAGRYLSKNRQRLAAAPANVILASPAEAGWEPYTAASLIPLCSAVVTTPSTVALDAAELDVPVAVAAYDLDLPVFAGLPLIGGKADWLAFVEKALANPKAARSGVAAFRDRLRLPGDAVPRIVDLLTGGGGAETVRAQRPERSTPLYSGDGNASACRCAGDGTGESLSAA